MTHAHILVVDDARSIRDTLAALLCRNGFKVTKAEDAVVARHLLACERVDLVVLDLMMPGEDGLSLCRSIREESSLPVIIMTAKAREDDRVIGLETGADDYVIKPFSPRELVARIKAVLRRTAGEGGEHKALRGQPDTYRFGEWVLNVKDREIVDTLGVSVPLSAGEFRILLALVKHANQTLRRDQLASLAQRRELGAFERSIDNHISRLRKKIEVDASDPKLIKTVWGDGYMLVAEVQVS